MPEGHDTTIEVSNIMSFVLYTQILKQSVLKPASPGITLIMNARIEVCTLKVKVYTMYQHVGLRGHDLSCPYMEVRKWGHVREKLG